MIRFLVGLCLLPVALVSGAYAVVLILAVVDVVTR